MNKIMKIKNKEGNMEENPTKIAEVFVDYFENILNNFESSNRSAQEKMLKAIPRIITEEDNLPLNKPFTLEEIKSTLFNINPDKCPRPKRFQAFLFSKMLGNFRG